MADKSGIKVENRRPWSQKELKVDFKSLLLTLGKSAVNIGFLQFDDLAENGVELLESLGLETSPEEIAGLLIVRSLKQAIFNLNEEYEESFNPELLNEIPKSLKDLSSHSSSTISDGKLIINSDFFAHQEHISLVSEIKSVYAEWLKSFVNNPIDAEKVSSSEPRPNFQEEMRQSRNAEESLLAVLNACARTTQEISDIKWHSPVAFGSWFARLQPQRKGEENTLAFRCLSWLNLENCVLHMRDFYAANLEGADLRVADLQEANLQRVNFREANLRGADLRRVNLQGANLAGADLQNTILEGRDIDEITSIKD